MMSEINTHDTMETRDHGSFEYTNIKPETNMTPKEAREQWDAVASGRQEIGSGANEVKDSKADVDSGRDEKEYEGENSEKNPTHITTSNEALDGKEHPETGIPFEKMKVQMPNGEWIEGVFAKFTSEFDTKIPESMYLDSNRDQFKECNKQLSEAIEKDPELKAKFTDEQIEQIHDGIQDGTAPDGYVWHHDIEVGKMQLVDAEIHAKTGHRGGRSTWGSERFNR